MRRREILKGLLFGGLSTMSIGLLSPMDARAAERDVVDVTLTSRPHTFSPTPNVTFDGLAFNGQIPGPLLRVRHGQRFRARYINRSGGPSTIHWHGMILPNAMDGVPNVTQAPIPDGGEFIYEFTPGPPGFRWYHSHVAPQNPRGLFGAFIVDDPNEQPADVEAVLVFHDVPDMTSFNAALHDASHAHMVAPMGAPEMADMTASDKASAHAMGDEVAYLARCINGATWPRTKPIEARVGQRVRLRILNASPTITHYIAAGGHQLRVTHSDGNPLPRPVTVDALRVGVAERYDAWLDITRPGAWLVEAIADDGQAIGQSVVVHTPGMAQATPERPAQSLRGEDWFTYLQAGDAGPLQHPVVPGPIDVDAHLALGEGARGAGNWTINGRTWPDTRPIDVHRDDRVLVHFTNPTDMAHPMHLHGHVFHLVALNGQSLGQPLPKDTTLVPAKGGTATWFFKASSPPGRWMLHCHNDIHMADGMMTDVRYI
ncbi:multicopper oxidase family protein [Salinisphaera sp. Q1T1-3]|uniref:multicopper oxidase family protein n=1 Tax=Salinisphaera sp. Q1T1-3 TaxID=2321229 RepID=UPI0013142567|nr:multicopper oxidase family protein [Salinisphaera sp. Q1T1-3]